MRQRIDKIATQFLRYTLPTLILLTPLFFIPVTTDFFATNKKLIVYLIATLSLIAWNIRNLTRKRMSVTNSPALLPFIGLITIFLLSSFIQAPNPFNSIMGRTATLISLFIIFFTATSSQKNDSVIKTTFISLIISSSLLSLSVILQTTGITEKIITASFLKGKLFSPIGGPLLYLSFILPVLPATLYLAFKTNKFSTRITALIASLLNLVGTFTQLKLILPQTDENRLILLPFSAGWSIAIDTFKSIRTTLLGVGPENFITAFTTQRPISLNYTPFWDNRFYSSSTEMFTILTTVGIIGLVLFLIPIIKTFLQGLKTNKLDSELNSYHTANMILLSLTTLVFFIIPTSISVYVLLFVSLSLTTIILKLDGNQSIHDLGLNLYNQLSDKTPKGSYLLPLPLAIISLFFVIYFWRLEVPIYRASLETYQAIILLNTDAQTSYQKQISAYQLDPNNPIYRINFAQTSLSLANNLASKKDISDQEKESINQLVQQGIREAKNATSLEPSNVTTWENLASVYRQLLGFADGAQDWTVAAYTQAILLDPTNSRLRFELGSIYYSLGDLDNAANLIQQAIDRKSDWANYHYNLAAIYKSKKDYTKALSEMKSVLSLVQNNSNDYEKVMSETKEIESLIPTPTPTPTQGNNQPTNPDIKLATPTPVPSTKPIDIPLEPTNSPTPVQ